MFGAPEQLHILCRRSLRRFTRIVCLSFSFIVLMTLPPLFVGLFSGSSQPPVDAVRPLSLRNAALKSADKLASSVTPVLIMSASRPEVQLVVRQVLAYRPSATEFPVIVSQDSDDAMTAAALAPLANAGEIEWHRRLLADEDENLPPARDRVDLITRHYKRALDYVLLVRRYRQVIVLEDDLLLAPDFFHYFRSLAPVLARDPSLFCVSAWHDNAMLGRVDVGPRGAVAVHRTDFFPGLGWMLRRQAWPAARARWPDREFDSYLRRYMLSNGLACLRPEVPRVFNTGQSGGNLMPGWYGATFHRRFLSRMVLNLLPDVRIPEDVVSRLGGGPSSDAAFAKRIASLPLISRERLLELATTSKTAGDADDSDYRDLPSEVQIVYRTAHDYTDLALRLGVIPDVWFGVPRCSRRGIVGLRLRPGVRVFLRPAVAPKYSPRVYMDYRTPPPLPLPKEKRAARPNDFVDDYPFAN